MAKILIIDDDKIMCETLSYMVQNMGHDAVATQRLQDGFKITGEQEFDIVLLDVRMPDGNGLEAIPEIKKMPTSPEIIIITGSGDADGAELAISSGAWDYIEKTSSVKDIRLALMRALEYRGQKRSHTPPRVMNRGGIIGNSQEINTSLDQTVKAAQSEANVLIMGETGTGKELFARALHLNSPRFKGDFIAVDCAALPGSIVESMLFGHEKGAFTGADSQKKGMIEQANGGTLFLDEIGELPLSIQKTFLRVLQERSFRPLGGKKEITSDFRLVSATNRNLEEMAKSGGFREDLLFRIQTVTINLPPLRERQEDIGEIGRFYRSKFCKLYGKPEKRFSEGFFQDLESYYWPGNVRELINTIEKVITEAGEEPIIFGRHLPTHIRVQAARRKVSKKTYPPHIQPEKSQEQNKLPKMRDFVENMRAEYIKELMAQADGDVKSACELSGLSRARLYQLLKKYRPSIPD